MNTALTPSNTYPEQTREETKKPQPSTLDHITHDIVNHLSIICLCCCELRNSIVEKLEPDQLKDFARIEGAVQDAAEKIQQLRAILRDYEITGKDEKSESPVLVSKTEIGFYTDFSRFISPR